MPQSVLQKLDYVPSRDCCKKSHLILKATIDSCASLLSTFQANKARTGAPRNADQDLLRAMLVFAASGLDAMMKQLILEALPIVIDKSEGAHQQFVLYIEKQLMREPKDAAKFLAKSIASSSPRDLLIKSMIQSLRNESLQSKDQIFQTASYFDIASPKLSQKPEELKDVFKIRNGIIHEMDVNLVGSNRKRHHRKRDDIVKNVNVLLTVAIKFLREVDSRC